LPPAIAGLDVTVSRLQSLRPDMPIALDGGGAAQLYLEELEGTAEVLLSTQGGDAVAVTAPGVTYLGGWLDPEAMDRVVAAVAQRAGIETLSLPEGIRLRDTASERFLFNHTTQPVAFLGHDLPPAGVVRLPRG
jgi:beta-galactosidase